MKSLILGTLILGLSTSALASHKAISLGQPEFAGTGCPADEPVGVAYLPASGTLAISFPESLIAEADLVAVSRKACMGAIPVKIPAGKRLVLKQAVLRGEVETPENVKAKINGEIFIPPSKSIPLEGLFGDGSYDRGAISISEPSRETRSDCGTAQMIRFNLSTSTSRSYGVDTDGAYISINQITFNAVLEDCQ